jgi:hypothetical protein
MRSQASRPFPFNPGNQQPLSTKYEGHHAKSAPPENVPRQAPSYQTGTTLGANAVVVACTRGARERAGGPKLATKQTSTQHPPPPNSPTSQCPGPQRPPPFPPGSPTKGSCNRTKAGRRERCTRARLSWAQHFACNQTAPTRGRSAGRGGTQNPVTHAPTLKSERVWCTRHPALRHPQSPPRVHTGMCSEHRGA